jgi:Cof subfamily protein (haloacid dehalogenase superfamily)
LITLDAVLAPKLAGIRLVLMDIDGTLISGDTNTFGNVLTQLRKLRPLGIGISIATGRTICGASFVTKQLQELGSHLPPMITYNGAVVLSGRDSSVVERRLIDRSAFEAVIKRCRAKGVEPLAYACGAQFDFVPRETVYTEGAPHPDPDFNGMKIRSVPDLLAVVDDFVAVLIEAPATEARSEIMAELSQTFGQTLRVTTSGGRYIEICHPLGTKLNAMTELARMQRISVQQIMAIGDSFNDVEMIAGAGVGVAVANAPEAVQRVATLRTTLPSGQGVVQALRALTRAVRSWPRPQTLVS